MIFAAALLWTAVARGDGPGTELASETFQVQAHDYRYIQAKVANWPATMNCTAEVSSGGPVRIELVADRELIHFVRGRPHEFLLSLSERRKTTFSQALPEKGEYDILFINDHDQPSQVRLEATVRLAREPDVAKYLPPGKRLTVIVISLLVFVVTMSWSAAKLMTAMRNHRDASSS